MDIFVPNMKFSVRFVVNRYPLRVQHRAVQLAEEHSCSPWLFPTPGSIGMHPMMDPASLNLRSVGLLRSLSTDGIIDVCLCVCLLLPLLLNIT
jgi:hypothetical protein